MKIEPLMTIEELAKRWKLNPGTLAMWRADGKGPPYVKPSDGTVLYYVKDIIEWEKKRTVKPKN